MSSGAAQVIIALAANGINGERGMVFGIFHVGRRLGWQCRVCLDVSTMFLPIDCKSLSVNGFR